MASLSEMERSIEFPIDLIQKLPKEEIPLPNTNTTKPPIGPKNWMKKVISSAKNNPVMTSKPNIQSGLFRNLPE